MALARLTSVIEDKSDGPVAKLQSNFRIIKGK